MLHRYALKGNYQPDEVIKAVDAAMASTTDDVLITFNNGFASSTDANFYGPRRNNLGSYRPTDLIIRYLDGNVFEGVSNPRKDFLFKPSADGVVRGIRTPQVKLPLRQRLAEFVACFLYVCGGCSGQQNVVYVT